MSAPEIAGLLDGQETPRAFKRFQMQFIALVARAAGYDQVNPPSRCPKVEALVTDISMSGLRFATTLEFPIDTIIEVEMTIGVKTHSVPVIVRRCEPIKRPGRYSFSYGAQYIKSPYTAAFVPTLAKYLISRGLLKSEQPE